MLVWYRRSGTSTNHFSNLLIQFYFNNVTKLHQLISHSTTSCPTTWRSYRNHSYRDVTSRRRRCTFVGVVEVPDLVAVVVLKQGDETLHIPRIELTAVFRLRNKKKYCDNVRWNIIIIHHYLTSCCCCRRVWLFGSCSTVTFSLLLSVP